MEMTDTCPQCKAPMGQRLRDEHYYTCTACQEVFIHDNAFKASREVMLNGLETASAIVNNSRGKLGDKAFVVTGCTSIFLERSSFNLHAIQWNDGQPGFLVENDGDFLMAEEIRKIHPNAFKKVNPGRETELSAFGKAYCCSMDKILYISLSGTGKLAFPTYTGAVCCGFYKEKNEGAFAFITREDASLLSGKFYEFKDLNLSPVRAIHEWYK